MELLLTEIKILLPADLFNLLDTLVTFAKESTKAFDESHNHIHALEVTRNALKIDKINQAEQQSSYQSNTSYISQILVLAMLHDICDHKYKELSITQDQLIKFMESLSFQYPSINSFRAIKIIDSISYSKQVKKTTNESELTNDELQLLHILRDADRIEAIGTRGIERCYQYNKQASPGLDEVAVKADVIQHCHDKLLRLYPEKFITTSGGRAIAEPLHQEMIAFVAANS